MVRLENVRETAGQRFPAMMNKDLTYSVARTTAVERILVVEDDHAVQKALRRLFETEGFETEIAADGKSAVESFRKAPPSVIVLDLRLPLMSGRDVCREIKQQ